MQRRDLKVPGVRSRRRWRDGRRRIAAVVPAIHSNDELRRTRRCDSGERGAASRRALQLLLDFSLRFQEIGRTSLTLSTFPKLPLRTIPRRSTAGGSGRVRWLARPRPLNDAQVDLLAHALEAIRTPWTQRQQPTLSWSCCRW